ncbi:sulfurtransferase complex subunit TusB [Paraglaciecola arctica]|uniref:sulfurtransferase complex subunit TusB n=1 Tax=Paraglaciecola arctica TaxID=1128911 RepID=UPI001C06EC2F|nr:sulfurtransferase complex subunit TusB [Paraglaciecola arctica]MBU3001730.1 sulfurtransferase complex subunit TusB [Paraglaciecola arctica]
MILHKVASSPFSHRALDHCLQRIHATDGLLLTQDAVYGLMDKELSTKLQQLEAVFVLKEDAEARGIEIEPSTIQLINYEQFVELCLKYEKVISW